MAHIENSLLNNLSESEQKIALLILLELSEKGLSQAYDDLLYADYDEIPVDISTFISDDRYLGNAWKGSDGKLKLYPFWQDRLKELFPDNLTTSVNNLIESGARGLGKSEIAVTIALYLMYRLMCLKDPHAFLHLKPTEKVVFAFANITKYLAEDIGISKFLNTVKKSPWFLERGTLTGISNKTWNPPEWIDIIIASLPGHLIGQPIYFCMLDEINFVRNQDIEKLKKIAIDMMDTALGGMQTRFIYKGKNPTLMVLASSKRSEKSFLEEHMRKKLEDDDASVMIIDKPVWEVKPPETYSGERFNVAVGNKFLVSEIMPDNASEDDYTYRGYNVISVPIEFKSNFLDNIDRALCDYAGIASSDLSKYISGARVLATTSTEFVNPFLQDVIEVGNAPTDTTQYKDYFDLNKIPQLFKDKPLYIHYDMSLSGEKGDKTGLAGVWITGKKDTLENSAKELIFLLAFSVSIKAPKGYQVSVLKNKEFIYWLKSLGFNIKGTSSDTYMYAAISQDLISKGYNYQIISVDRVDLQSHICKPYSFFKNCIYELRITLLSNKLLAKELVNLERNGNTGKVDHPESGCFTDDTKIALVDGRNISIKDLLLELKYKTNYVYSFNEDKKIIEPKPIVSVHQTKITDDLVKVTLDNGAIITCTSDHRFMLYDGSYEEILNLKPGDSLMSLYINESTGENHKIVKIERLNYRCKVYDLEIKDNHNFALAAGVFVHNSKDQADAVCGALWNASLNSEEFAYEYGEDLDSLYSTNTQQLMFNQNQISIDFEEELKKAHLFEPRSLLGTGLNVRSKETFIPDVIGGMLIW